MPGILFIEATGRPDMNAQFVRMMLFAGVVLALCLPLAGDVILDDDFEGTSLDTSVWEIAYWSTGTVSISDSRLHLSAGGAVVAPDTDGLNYVNMALYGVQGAGFGFGLSGALGGRVLFGVDDNQDAHLALNWTPAPYPDPLHTTSGYEDIDLGPASDGDFEIIWTPTLLQVINNGQVLFSRDDPDRIPYYYLMGPFSIWAYQDTALSVDRAVVTIPEPVTISMLSLGCLFLHHSRKRRRT